MKRTPSESNSTGLKRGRLSAMSRSFQRQHFYWPTGDTHYFRTKYGNALFVGPFHPGNGCRSANGKGDYVLLHGDFSTAENNAAARFILDEVIRNWKHKTVLAGKRPSDELMQAVSALRHVRVIPNPSLNQMSELITNAQVCLLNAFSRQA